MLALIFYAYLYSFARVAITIHYRPGGLNKQKFISSQFWRLEVQDQGDGGLGFS